MIVTEENHFLSPNIMLNSFRGFCEFNDTLGLMCSTLQSR